MVDLVLVYDFCDSPALGRCSCYILGICEKTQKFRSYFYVIQRYQAASSLTVKLKHQELGQRMFRVQKEFLCANPES